MSEVAAAGARSGGFRGLLRNWGSVVNTANLPRGASMDPISKWLIITRAAVFSMTYTSGLIGGLLAAQTAGVDVNWWFFALAMVGLVIAHAANNMINDYFDVEGGVDDAAYPRAQYAPHPLLSGLTTKRGLITAIFIANAIDAAIMLYLAIERGPLVLLFALAGLFISVFYVAKPIVLKRRGLGEIGVLIVWGPLMIGGSYFVAAGELPAWVWAACLPYSLIVMSVLVGKHLDKFEIDQSKGIKTLPVILGYGLSRRLNQAIMVGFYVAVAALIATGVLGAWVGLTALALPRLVQVLGVYRRPPPEEAPPGYPLWPLWYVSAAFYFNKRAGELFVLGLFINLLLPWHLR
jgi:1,4-dihydroxy-2-naphthoate octaprenyltransferase